MPCESVLLDELPAGLLVYVSRSSSGAGPYSALVTADGALRRLPQVVDGVAGGDLALSTVEPGRLIALTDLRSDLWPLNLTTRSWQQLPDMPLRLGPSKPQATWTADGRLLLLAGLADDPASGLVAVWRPGQPRIAVRRLRSPIQDRPAGSGS